MRMPPRLWPLIVPILLASAWLGIRRLNADGIWYDEWWSLYVAGASYFGPPLAPDAILARIATEDVWQTPGYPLALSAWGNLAGWTEFAGRAFSLLCGLIAVAAVYALGKRLAGQLAGLGAAAALGGSAWFVFHLHELRAYMPLVMFTSLCLLAYFHALRRPSRIAFLALTLSAAALIYTHYFAAIPLSAIALWHLARALRDRLNRRWWAILSCLIAAGLLFLPWLLYVLGQINPTTRPNRVEVDTARMLTYAGEVFYVFSSGSVGLFALLALIGLRQRAARIIWPLAGLMLLIGLLVMRALGLFELRYLIGALPALALIAGLGIQAIGESVQASNRRGAFMLPAAACVVWIVGAAFVQGDPRFEQLMQRTPSLPLREMARTVGPYLRDGDAVIHLLGDDLWPTIQANPMVHYYGNLPGRRELVERRSLPSLPAYAERVRQAAGNAPILWIADAPQWPDDERSLAFHLLASDGYQPCGILKDTRAMRIQIFAAMRSQGDVAIADGITARLLVAPRLVHADGANRLAIWLGFWIAPGVPTDLYSYSLRIEDAAGSVLAQSDSGLPGQGPACRLLELPGAPVDGGVRLRLVIYNWQTLEPLGALTLADPIQAE